MITYMTKFAEEIFEPKCILSNTDWLNRYREPDQRFDNYRKDQTNKVKWVTQKRNKIYLYAPSFNHDHLKKYRSYAEAFFMGIAGVEVLKPGAVIPGPINENKTNPARAPADFLESQTERRDVEEGT